MTGELQVRDSCVAGESFASKIFYCVNINNVGRLVTATAGKAISGIIQDKSVENETATFARPGSISEAILSASQLISVGDLLEVGSDGNLVLHGSGVAVARARTGYASVDRLGLITVEILTTNAAFS